MRVLKAKLVNIFLLAHAVVESIFRVEPILRVGFQFRLKNKKSLAVFQSKVRLKLKVT